MAPSRLCLLLSYLGTRYQGWQRQPQGLTLQGLLEEAQQRISGTWVPVVGSGRTDAGVHALGQVAHLDPPLNLAEDAWIRALNANLPQDVRVRGVWKVPRTFHARRSARSRIYVYLLHETAVGSPFLEPLTWQLPGPLDLAAMEAAARTLVGTHDFAGFAAASALEGPTLRTLIRVEIREIPCPQGVLETWLEGIAGGGPPGVPGRLVALALEANAFLHHMVRNIVGTLVEVGRGRRAATAIQEILAARDRRLAGPTAPPQGLYLVGVRYPDGLGPSFTDRSPQTSSG